LRRLIRDRLRLGTQAWLAGDAANWESLRLLALLKLSDENQKVLAALRTFAFWLRLDDRVEIHGAVQGVDPSAAALLEKMLRKALAKENNYLNVLGAGPEGRLVTEELVKSLKIDRSNAYYAVPWPWQLVVVPNQVWVTLEAVASGETVRKAVGK
jgi:hypothetical protein